VQSALNPAAHIAGTEWSTKRYLRMNLLKGNQMRSASSGHRSAKTECAKKSEHHLSESSQKR